MTNVTEMPSRKVMIPKMQSDNYRTIFSPVRISLRILPMIFFILNIVKKNLPVKVLEKIPTNLFLLINVYKKSTASQIYRLPRVIK